jgi:hypothetical protein
MTRTEIIDKFRLYMDDTSDLSSAEEVALVEKIYQKISAEKPWEGTKTVASGTLSSTVPYVSLPDDFSYLVTNQNYTDSQEYGASPAILVGADYSPNKVISWSDRRQYRNRTGYAFIDWANNRLEFTAQPAADAYEFDYHKVPTALDATDEPWFPARFHDLIVHGMCEDSFMIQLSDKAKSYAREHADAYKKMMAEMEYWNAQLVQLD